MSYVTVFLMLILICYSFRICCLSNMSFFISIHSCFNDTGFSWRPYSSLVVLAWLAVVYNMWYKMITEMMSNGFLFHPKMLISCEQNLLFFLFYRSCVHSCNNLHLWFQKCEQFHHSVDVIFSAQNLPFMIEEYIKVHLTKVNIFFFLFWELLITHYV